MDGYTLICPFLTDDPMFYLGVEFGILYSKMNLGLIDEIEDFFHIKNQDQILLLASRLGWTVKEIGAYDKDWFWCRMTKGGERQHLDTPDL